VAAPGGGWREGPRPEWVVSVVYPEKDLLTIVL